MAAPPQTRWFHPTPGRFVLALLAVEVLLWLSDRFGWLGWHKGYAVLTGVAVVGVAMVLLLVWFAVALVFRRRFQFSLRSLLALVVVVALPCSWLAVEVQAAKRQKDAVTAILSACRPLDCRPVGPSVWYDYQVDESGLCLFPPRQPGPEWLLGILGDDFFANVLIADAHADFGLEHLTALKSLRGLALASNEFSDAKLSYLKCLTHLKSLDLEWTHVTDEGLRNIEGLSGLEEVNVGFTEVTHEGMERLQRALPKCKIVPEPPAKDESQGLILSDQTGVSPHANNVLSITAPGFIF